MSFHSNGMTTVVISIASSTVIFLVSYNLLFHHHHKLAKPHNSVSSIVDLKTGGRWFDPHLGLYSFGGLMLIITTGFIPLSPLSVVFDNGYVGKQPVAWKEYCAEYWLKELQRSMDGCNGRCDITEILLKNSIKHHSINQSIIRKIDFIYKNFLQIGKNSLSRIGMLLQYFENIFKASVEKQTNKRFSLGR